MIRRGALVAVVALLVACSNPPASPGGSMPPTASDGPSAATSPVPGSDAPSAAPSAPASIVPLPSEPLAFDQLIPYQAVRVAAVELNIRELPRTTAKRLAILKQGDILIITGIAPVRANGFNWFEVMRVVQAPGSLPALPAYPLDAETGLVAGWVAAGNANAGDFIRALPFRCPDTIDLTSVGGMPPGERLACLGGATIELLGTYGCSECGGMVHGSYEPEWLASRLEFGLLSVAPETRFGPLAIHFPPEVAEPAIGSVIRVRGHFDDPRSADCRVAEIAPDQVGPAESLVPVEQGSARLWCREKFVVESYDDLGPDPDFPA
jgi:hypothetical protein